MNNLKQFLAVNKMTVILVAAIALIVGGGFFTFQKFSPTKQEVATEEVDIIFDAEGPYAQLYPRKDGNALVLNLKRTSSYDSISYELAYTSKVDEITVGGEQKTTIQTDEGQINTGSIDRGVVGTIDTKDKKGEYEQEILLGTCSKNVCKYDKGVENGTLTLHIKKGNQAFRMITQWHLQKVDVSLGNLSSGDNHLVYKVEAEREALANVAFSVVNDLTGVPKLPNDKEVLGKVYALNIPIAKDLPSGDVSLELAESPSSDSKLYRFDGTEWKELDTKVEGAKLSSKTDGAGIFAVLTSKK